MLSVVVYLTLGVEIMNHNVDLSCPPFKYRII